MQERQTTKGQTLFTFAYLLQRSPRPRPTAKALTEIMDVLIDHRQVLAVDGFGKHPDYQLRETAHAK